MAASGERVEGRRVAGIEAACAGKYNEMIRRGEPRNFHIDIPCGKVNDLPCDPGMKGCVLAGRYIFFGNEEKNERLRRKRAQDEGNAGDPMPEDIAGNDTEP